MRERPDGGEDRLRRAGGDGYLVLRVVAGAIKPLHLAGDRLTQRHHAGAQRILVVPRAHRRRHQVDQDGVDRVIGKSLPQVDGAVLLRERRHHAEDGGPRGREPGANVERDAGRGHGGRGRTGVRGGRDAAARGCGARSRRESRGAPCRGRCDNEHTKTVRAEGGMGDGKNDRAHRGRMLPYNDDHPDQITTPPAVALMTVPSEAAMSTPKWEWRGTTGSSSNPRLT